MKGDICKKKNKIEQDRQSFTSCLQMCFPENRLTPIVSIHVMKMKKKSLKKKVTTHRTMNSAHSRFIPITFHSNLLIMSVLL